MANQKIQQNRTQSDKVLRDKAFIIVNKCNNSYKNAIKMKPTDVTSDFYAEYNEDSNEKDPKFRVCDRVRISKYKNIFAKGYTPNQSEVFIISKIKNTIS